MENVVVKVQRISDSFADIPIPNYETSGSAGMDLRAAVKDYVKIEAGKFVLIPTNLKVEIPAGYEIQVRPRSGLAAKYGIGVLNSPGTIDSDYRGEIKVILFNFSTKDFLVHKGDRIAQMVLAKVYKMTLVGTEYLSSSDRGEGGFGHTGKS
jgi:dUTP pyrophosphatase